MLIALLACGSLIYIMTTVWIKQDKLLPAIAGGHSEVLNASVQNGTTQRVTFFVIDQSTGPAETDLKYKPLKDITYATTGATVLAINRSPEKNLKYRPLKDVIYNTTAAENSDHSVFVVPRRAFYDNRLVKRKPLNQVIVLAEANDNATETIVDCEVNGVLSKSVRVEVIDASWVRYFKPGYTHRLLLIKCFGLPRNCIINNTIVRIIYKRNDEDFYSRVKVEMPLYLAKHKNKNPFKSDRRFDRGKGSVVVCSALFGHPPMFDQWLKYQQTLKVDMVHLNVDSSFYDNATHYPFLKEALETGFVQMHVWSDIVGKRIFYKSQLVKWHDCLYRYIGVFEFAFFIDMDDFLVPALPEHRDIHYYLNKYFADKHVGGLYFSWQQMQCKPVPEKVKTLPDGNLTSILSGSKAYWRTESKCAYRLNGVVLIMVHQAQISMPGYKIIRPDKNEMYVAHLRKSENLCS